MAIVKTSEPPICPSCKQHECGRIKIWVKNKWHYKKEGKLFYGICWWCAKYERKPSLLDFDERNV